MGPEGGGLAFPGLAPPAMVRPCEEANQNVGKVGACCSPAAPVFWALTW